ncbi:cysteine hydrolase [Paenibacillus spiritus]|uniref:Cysteine hydrolase n=1 Tax=Paenibacillus spiritus TaxID=2496557 RepID=A0A5J5G971_9BACL|nr:MULTISPECIES: cysteine hydrolase family protein [Paenibacillus]KAA9004162.1 cysteine hydrolase [Paenibacillus spiritus]
MGKSALLLIDVQEAMFSYPDEKLFDEEGVMERILLLLRRARQANVPVVFVRHTEEEEFAEGSPTWEISARLNPQPGEAIVNKTACDSFYKTELQDKLRALGVDHLVVAGMQSEFCVDTTTRRAFSLGYRVTLVEDGHSTFGNGRMTGEEIVRHHNGILGGGRFANLARAAEIEW